MIKFAFGLFPVLNISATVIVVQAAVNISTSKGTRDAKFGSLKGVGPSASGADVMDTSKSKNRF